MATALLSVVIVITVLITGGGSKSKAKTRPPATAVSHPAPKPIPAIEAGLLPWHLDAPLSRETVLPGTGDSLVVAGGLTSSHRPSSKIFRLATPAGSTSPLGTLAAAAFDAAGGQLPSGNLTMGGATPAAVGTVQVLTTPGGGASSPGPVSGSIVGSLPQPRAGATAVTIGPTLYILGGSGGAAPESTVLSTADGHHFRSVATLPVAVSHAAVASLGGTIYLFGGETAGGSLVDDIQSVDPTNGKTTIVGHLPQPTAGAFAAVLGGNVYVAGGITNSPAGTVPAAATTQTSTRRMGFRPLEQRNAAGRDSAHPPGLRSRRGGERPGLAGRRRGQRRPRLHRGDDRAGRQVRLGRRRRRRFTLLRRQAARGRPW